MRKVVIIVQARMSSSRLPGKILKQVLDKPLLQYQLERLKRVKNADKIVIATTVNACDDPIALFCMENNVDFYRGSEEDVLSRYYEAAKQFEADLIVRITSDCPLIDPAVVEKVISKCLEKHNENVFYSNCLSRTYPRGMDTEVFTYKMLKQANDEAKKSGQREHVTSFFYSQPEKFTLTNVANPEGNFSKYRWTVDTLEDFTLIKEIIEYLYISKPEFTMRDCLNAYKLNCHWHDINKHIEQKKV